MKIRKFTLGVACFFCAITAIGFVPFTQTGGATASSCAGTGSAPAAAQLADSALAQGLITPQEDDPVLFTTDYGLDIKWGNSLISGTADTTTGLNGFLYIQTNDGTKNYYWCIIGQAPDMNIISGQKICDLISKSKISEPESTTPAGDIVNQEVQNDLYAYTVTQTDEIPSGCVLVLANDIIEEGCFTTTESNVSNYMRYISSYVETSIMRQTLTGYYDNKSLGLGAIYDKIQELTMTSTGGSGINDGVYTSSATLHIFPLSYNDEFAYMTYLTQNQAKSSSTWWLRSGATGCIKLGTFHYDAPGRYITTEGEQETQAVTYTAGYRPAFVLQL